MGKDTPQVEVYTNADIPNAILKEKYVIVLTVYILPNLIKDSFTNFNLEQNNEQWYNNDSTVGNIR